MVNKLNRPNLDDAMTFQRVKAGCLGIDHDFTHGGFIAASALDMVTQPSAEPEESNSP